jgi:hypothetical protein
VVSIFLLKISKASPTSNHFFYSMHNADTVNGFAFHPFLPMAVSSSGHRRFKVPDGCDENLPLTGNYIEPDALKVFI